VNGKPTYVDDRPRAFSPAGKQTLNGEQVLLLARIRLKYPDATRINNQTLIMRAIFKRLKEPRVMLKLPQLLSILEKSVITDLAPEQKGMLYAYFHM
jgi:anionic cell wall polymer biosynthesis LytR-Cps2A-Psr (LCP) family protein